MRRDIIRDVILMAFCKKALGEKALGLLKGMIFFPFLARDFAPSDRKDEDMSVAISAAGDDIYPLF